MYQFLLIIAIIVCVFLILMVLIQNPKGGGLSSNFSSSSQLMGVQRTGDFLEKGTWILAITLMVISLAMNVASKSGGGDDSQVQQTEANKAASKPTNTGAAPAMQMPAGGLKPNGAAAPAGTPAPQKPVK